MPGANGDGVTVTFCAYDRPGGGGGPLAWAEHFVAFLAASNFNVRVLILCRGGAQQSQLAQHCTAKNIPVAVLDTDDAQWMEDQVEWILRDWRKNPSRVFIANLVVPAFYASRWIREAGGRTVGVMHSNPAGDPFHEDLLRQFIATPGFFQLDVVVSVSQYVTAKVREVASPATRLETIPCGTPSSALRASPPDSELRILYCGRLVQKAKRIRELTEAMIAATRLGGVKATICGDGEEKNWVASRVGLEADVEYIGQVEPSQVHDIMLDHHAIILLSDFEGLPMAVVEGMSCGLVPVCLAEPSGSAEIIENGRNGFIVSDRGRSFLDAVSDLKDPDLWSTLSVCAQQTAQKRYVHEVVFNKWANLITTIPVDTSPRPQDIPRRVSLTNVHSDGLFVGYPRVRPPRSSLMAHDVRRMWDRIRQAIRPRARARKLVTRLRA